MAANPRHDTRRRLVCLIAVVVVTSAACGGPARPRPASVNTADFVQIDAAATLLDLGSVGTVILDSRSGRAGFSEAAPTRQIVVEGDDVAARVTAQLTSKGFEQSGATSWTSGSVTVLTREVASTDDVVDQATGKVVHADPAGVNVYIRMT